MSKLKKIALIPLLTCMLNTNEIKSQKEQTNLNLYINGGIKMLYNHSDYKLEPFENWEEFFRPWGGSMEYHNKRDFLKTDFSLGVEPAIQRKKIEIGIPISISSSYLNFKQGIQNNISKEVLNWWDPVIMRSISVHKTAPEFGISARIRGKKENSIEFKFITYPYSTYINDFQGIDVYGGVNSSWIVRKEKIDNGWGKRLSIGISHKDNYSKSDKILIDNGYLHPENRNSFSLYIEKIQKNLQVGLSWEFNFNLREKRNYTKYYNSKKNSFE
jgi:hypothetical protein